MSNRAVNFRFLILLCSF